MKNTKEKIDGITLVALVVTIVVLLVLTGITISYVMGDNSVFKKAQDAKLQTDIAKWQEMLETAKTPIIVEGLGKFNPEKYFKYIGEQGIIEGKETAVIDKENGTYDVTTKPGYIFEVELIPSQENPRDAEIMYVGQAGKIKPIIKKIETSATPTSITAKAIVTRLGNGTITYYYKVKSASDDTYTQITNVNEETGATQSGRGIVPGTEYSIKVIAKNEAGEVVETAEITATKIPIESITLNKNEEKVEMGKTVQLSVTINPDDATNKNVTWESSNPEVATVSSRGVVTGKTIGTTTITVNTTDGSEKSASCEITVTVATSTAIELNSVRARIATGSTRWLTAIAEPENAPQEFEWTSSNTNVATVDSSGKITTKAVGTTNITVKTKDGTDLSKTCKVTVANGVDITTLTSIQSSNKVAKDSYGNLITVPGGFKVVTSQATNVTQGIVIQDNEGNEFVWVPVDSVSKGENERADDIRLGRYTFDTKNGTPTKRQDADNYTEIVNIDTYQELANDSQNTTAKNLGDFVTQTQANGGYYLGRYEASYKDSTHCYSKKSTSYRMVNEGNIALTSGMLWNYITYPNAMKIARNSFTSSYVESDLMNSYSWDTAIVFIQNYSGNSNYANARGSRWQVLTNTGVNKDQVCNINDMASNTSEWTTEANEQKSLYVDRGGNCSSNVTTYPAMRGSYSTTTSTSLISFRPLLYVK